jgi:multiple sugar transport system permease protein
MSYQGTKINPDRFDKSQLKFYFILVPLAIAMLLPIVYIVNQAFKPLDELFMFPPRFFVQKPTLKNFEDLFRTASTTGVPMVRYLFNSIVITVVAVFSSLMITTMAAYALSKKNFKWKQKLFDINQLALMFVPVAVAIPRYLVIVQSGLINNFWSHILPLLAIPVGLFLMKQFIDQIPDVLLEAAYLDGANDITILRHVIYPLTKPALATVAILTFQIVWNSVDASNFYITDETLKSFAFYLTTLTANVAQSGGQASIAGAGMAAAAGLILFLPNLIIFVIMQSKVINTLASSGIK